MTEMRLINKGLKKTYKMWSRFLPSTHRLYRLPTGGNVYIDITESSMMFNRVIGEFEKHKHRALDFFLREGDAYIDIGGNKGEFAIHAALAVGERGRVVLFEPEPDNCKWIRKSIEQSDVRNIDLVEAAVGAEDGSASLFMGQKSGWHSLVKCQENLRKETITVQVRQLDKYLEEHPLARLKAIKIDVEGFEREVLLGAHRTLSAIDNLVLFIDVHPHLGVKHAEIYDLLEQHGFSLFKELYPFDRPLDRTANPREILAIKGQISGH